MQPQPNEPTAQRSRVRKGRERERGGTSHHAIAHANSTQTELASEKHGVYIKTPDICLQTCQKRQCRLRDHASWLPLTSGVTSSRNLAFASLDMSVAGVWGCVKRRKIPQLGSNRMKSPFAKARQTVCNSNQPPRPRRKWSLRISTMTERERGACRVVGLRSCSCSLCYGKGKQERDMQPFGANAAAPLF